MYKSSKELLTLIVIYIISFVSDVSDFLIRASKRLFYCKGGSIKGGSFSGNWSFYRSICKENILLYYTLVSYIGNGSMLSLTEKKKWRQIKFFFFFSKCCRRFFKVCSSIMRHESCMGTSAKETEKIFSNLCVGCRRRLPWMGANFIIIKIRLNSPPLRPD